MEIFWAIGATIFYITFMLNRTLLRFDKDLYFYFVKPLAIGSAISIGLRLIFGSFPPLPAHGYGSLLCVGWEDMLFSLALIFLPHRYVHKNIAWFLTIVASMAFAYGHINQGYLWAFVTLFYPYFFSYKYGKKHGYGTVVAIHVTYDIIVHTTILTLYYLKDL